MSVVLIADDDPAIRETLSELVLSLGHEPLVAKDGEEAVSLALSRTPDLVITDYMMPRKTGIEVIRALRGEPNLAGVPVLLISAASPRETAEAWRYLPKPCSLAELEHCITQAIS
jgi:CheY-like chemotaxis protein